MTVNQTWYKRAEDTKKAQKEPFFRNSLKYHANPDL